MQKSKEEYYSSRGGERQRRILDRNVERIITEKKDIERFIQVLAPVFKGVYFVNLETDTLRQIFIPTYFKEMLEESNERFSKALMLYASRMVKSEYIPDFKRFCDYMYLEQLLDGEDIPEFIYEKKDGCRLKLRVLKFSTYSDSPKETLWIFSDIKEPL